MSAAYEVVIDWTVATRLDLANLEALARKTLRAEKVKAPAALNVLLTDDKSICALNRRFRAIDAPTDVLSFAEYDELPAAAPPGFPRYIADSAISLETARRQAASAKIPLADEVSHLLVHGILHALGYDHEAPADEAKMRAREDAILGRSHHH